MYWHLRRYCNWFNDLTIALYSINAHSQPTFCFVLFCLRYHDITDYSHPRDNRATYFLDSIDVWPTMYISLCQNQHLDYPVSLQCLLSPPLKFQFLVSSTLNANTKVAWRSWRRSGTIQFNPGYYTMKRINTIEQMRGWSRAIFNFVWAKF